MTQMLPLLATRGWKTTHSYMTRTFGNSQVQIPKPNGIVLVPSQHFDDYGEQVQLKTSMTDLQKLVPYWPSQLKIRSLFQIPKMSR